MAFRVADTDVKGIIDTDIDVVPFIQTAELIVTEQLGAAGLSTERLFQIELYLAAHFVAITDQRSVSESIGGASISFGSVLGKGLDQTIFGQQVRILDTTGILGNLGKRKANFIVYGSLPARPVSATE
jgi:hypothetical protein